MVTAVCDEVEVLRILKRFDEAENMIVPQGGQSAELQENSLRTGSLFLQDLVSERSVLIGILAAHLGPPPGRHLRNQFPQGHVVVLLNLGDLYTAKNRLRFRVERKDMCQTLQTSFSAVSKPISATKYSF